MTDVREPDGCRGLFITFEGTEGSGKSTQVRLLAERLREEGYRVTENREPGTTRIGREVRQILLDPAYGEMAPMTELLLMFASRAQAASESIQPALNRGEIVLSDRFTDSSLVYQGEGRRLGMDVVRELHRLALGSLTPDLTFLVDIDLQVGLERAHRRNRDSGTERSEERIDKLSYEFHERVKKAYADLAACEPERFRKVDGSGDAGEIASRIWVELRPFLRRVSMKR